MSITKTSSQEGGKKAVGMYDTTQTTSKNCIGLKFVHKQGGENAIKNP